MFDLEHQTASLQLAAELRRAGLDVVLYPDAEKLSRQFKYASRIQARIVLVVGPDELRAGQVTLKQLATGVQNTVERTSIVDACRQILEGPQAQ